MKVSEAKEKVCPFIYNMVSTALGESEGANINCICGDCMAWEYTKEEEVMFAPKTGEYQQEQKILKGLKSEGWKARGKGIEYRLYKKIKDDDKEGYCLRLKR